MARLGMVRLGSALLALTPALLAAPSRGAMIRHESAATFPADPAEASAWRGLVRDGGRFDVSGWPVAEGPADSVREVAPRPCPFPEPILLGWTPADFDGIRALAAPRFREGLAVVPAAGDGPKAEPPLALAGFLGVAAWAVLRRRAERRSKRPARSRRPRTRGTASVPARRSAPAGRLPAPLPRRFEPAVIERPRILPARFVEVSTTTLPARRAVAGVPAVSVRRRGDVRRIRN